MNNDKLQQDHPCVINNIRKYYLNPPAEFDVPLHLDYPEISDPSEGQTRPVLHILNNKVRQVVVNSGN